MKNEGEKWRKNYYIKLFIFFREKFVEKLPGNLSQLVMIYSLQMTGKKFFETIICSIGPRKEQKI